MAAAFYNQLSPNEPADSAGTNVDLPGQTLEERSGGATSKAGALIEAMDEMGIDMRGKVRTPVTEEMLRAYDRVINMAEPEKTPDFLRVHPGYEYWLIHDPRNEGVDELRHIRDQIKQRVVELVAKGN